jgi:hypothetical protein
MAPVDGEIVSIEKMYQNFLTIFVSTPVVSCEMLLLLSLTKNNNNSSSSISIIIRSSLVALDLHAASVFSERTIKR